jgi:hypothetical protein
MFHEQSSQDQQQNEAQREERSATRIGNLWDFRLWLGHEFTSILRLSTAAK